MICSINIERIIPVNRIILFIYFIRIDKQFSRIKYLVREVLPANLLEHKSSIGKKLNDNKVNNVVYPKRQNFLLQSITIRSLFKLFS
jgi:hypothetical protein